MSTEIPVISPAEAIARIKKLIDAKDGDEGRLRYIAETIQKGKPLFRSDQNYLNRKIMGEVLTPKKDKPNKINEDIKNVKRLIALRLGDSERLQFILSMLEKKRPLYHTDEEYLQLKLKKLHEFYKKRKLIQPFRNEIVQYNEEKYQEFREPFSIRDKNFSKTEDHQFISEKLQKIENDIFLHSQDEDPEISDFTTNTLKINLEIDKERLEINRLKNIHELILEKNEELSQLKTLNQKYEVRINHEKEILEKQIKSELEKLKIKDEAVEQLILIQTQIIQIKTERESLQAKIKNEKEIFEIEFKEKQKEIDQLKNEYSQIKKEIEFRGQDTRRFFEKPKLIDSKGKFARSTKGKIQIVIVATGMILGFSGIMIKLTGIWPCDILEMIHISIPGIC